MCFVLCTELSSSKVPVLVDCRCGHGMIRFLKGTTWKYALIWASFPCYISFRECISFGELGFAEPLIVLRIPLDRQVWSALQQSDAASLESYSANEQLYSVKHVLWTYDVCVILLFHSNVQDQHMGQCSKTKRRFYFSRKTETRKLLAGALIAKLESHLLRLRFLGFEGIAGRHRQQHTM